MARVLITGSKGVIGTHVTRMLREKGHFVYGVDATHNTEETGWNHQLTKNVPTYSRCDVSDFRQIERILKTHGPFDFVYHTAAEFGRWNGEDFYEQLWRCNAIGTKNIITLQEELGFKLVHFSSSEIFGDYAGVITEDLVNTTPLRPMNDYAMSKMVNEMQIHNSEKMHGTQTLIVRLFNTYGPGEWYHPYRSVNCKFTYHALHNMPITVHRGHFRTSSYLEDTCMTLANIVDHFKAGESYNIAGTSYHDIETLADLVWKYTGADRSLITYADHEENTTINKKVDPTKAMRDLGHEPKTDLEEGVKKTVEWMREFYRK